ncbi:holo-ACP synthase [Cohnella lubricantis]|uniref:Holo-[acyl-carrier-protein] synthase n=1 Tax=Cohnella lubricantis TaxID=2163172 RepID=A0A841TD73_9BACL|nr:holo-ACP synthase [Cohnella lubricantis]MBB6678982.1 holo-ACP synthase [Cohnella lubricantis]MBP2118797.1 holo-[acyl-carrier protein] synthase [Cohnella lubricantis]
MIVGIGLDVVELGRMEKLLAGPAGGRFAARVLTSGELARYEALAGRRAAEFAAGRFAAKEAVVKALGCGIGQAVGFRDIEVLPDAAGRPIGRLSADAWARLGMEESVHSIHVAITHERSLAAATAIVERH